MTGDKDNKPDEHPTVVEDGVIHLDIRAEEEALSLSDLQWDDAPAFLLLWALAGVVFLQFFTRYVLNDSFGWTEEIARYLLICLAFVGCVFATRKGSHIAIEVFYVFMPRGMRRVFSTVIDIVLIGVYAWFAWLGADLSMRTQSLMVSIDLPKSVIYWTVAAGFAGMTVYQTLRTIQHLRTGTSNLIDPPGT